MKTIWITGGSSGIGFATADKFLKNNWKVVISSSNAEKLENAKERLKKNSNIKNLHILKCDISIKKEVEDTVNFIENSSKLFKKNKDIKNKDWNEFKKIMNKSNVSRKACLLLPLKTLLKAINN